MALISAPDKPSYEAASEFLSTKNLATEVKISVLRRSFSEPTRVVYKVNAQDSVFAMKLDGNTKLRNNLEVQYSRMLRLWEDNRNDSFFTVAKPIFLGKTNPSLFTDFCTGVPVSEILRSYPSEKLLCDVFCAIGRWLSGFQNSQNLVLKPNWPGWLLSENVGLWKNCVPQISTRIDNMLVSQTLKIMELHLSKIRGHPTYFSTQHGDLNSGNLIFDTDRVVAIDFSANLNKPQVTEIAKALLFDSICNTKSSNINKFGVNHQALECFLKSFKHQIKYEELSFYCLGYLLRLYLSPTVERLIFSEYQRERRNNVENRLRCVARQYRGFV